MNIVFMGTPEYVIPSLESLLSLDHAHLVGVYTQPDKPVGRGGNLTTPAVGHYCRVHGLPLFQPASLRNEGIQLELTSLEPDVVVVAAYGRILPPDVLKLPLHGCLNIHPSLLPRHRGPSPVVTALLEGGNTTGVTVMVVDEGMDSGPIVAQEATEIGPDEGAVSLTKRLFRTGGELVASILPSWVAGELSPVAQDESIATVTRKITKQDGEADWSLPAIQLARNARAFEAWPGLYTYLNGKVLKATKVRYAPATRVYPEPQGTVVRSPNGEVSVVTGDGLLVLDEVQLEGRRAMPSEEFLRGQRDLEGAVLPS